MDAVLAGLNQITTVLDSLSPVFAVIKILGFFS